MEATKNHIGLETAKLLKDYKIESNLIWLSTSRNKAFFLTNYEKEDTPGDEWLDFYPAYTWQEILWEHPFGFFGKPYIKNGHRAYFHPQKYYVAEIIDLLQQEKYQEADDYFRKYCILIKNHD